MGLFNPGNAPVALPAVPPSVARDEGATERVALLGGRTAQLGQLSQALR
jgi:hypothetical protein